MQTDAIESPKPRPEHPLRFKAEKWRKQLSDFAVGPTLVSMEVMVEVSRWDQGGYTSTPIEWLKVYVHPSHTIAYYSKRAEAVDVFSRGIALKMHHDALPMAVDNVTPAKKDEFCHAIVRLFAEDNGNMYVTREQVFKLLTQINGRQPSRHPGTLSKKDLRARIKRLEAQIIALGAVPVP